MESNELLNLAQTYRTPSFVFDEGAFISRMSAIREIFGEHVGLCFAVKANPFLIPAAAAAGAKLEVCSPGELDICRALGVDPEAIVFSGVNKTPKSVHDAIEYRVGTITAESPKHAALIEAEGAARGEVIPVLLRLNAESQFGMSRADLLSIIANRTAYPHIDIVGIHYFKGTQRMKLKHQRRELGMLSELIDEVRDTLGFVVKRLEYGPGLGVPLFVGDDFSDTLAPARELADDIRALAERIEVTVEMGRFFATECGTYLTAINDLKECDDMRYCIVDGGINHLTYLGNMMGMKVPVVEQLAAGAGTAQTSGGWCIAGSLCTTNDILVRNLELCEPREGDILAFHNAGAYAVTEGVALLLSRTLPRVIIRDATGTCRLARDFTETSPLNTALQA